MTVNEDAFDGIPDDLDRRPKANVEILREAAAKVVENPRRRLHFSFWRKPIAVEGDGRVEALVLERTRLDEAGKVVGTGETQRLETQLVLRSIGYRSVALPGVPFDERAAVISNVEGGSWTRPGSCSRGSMSWVDQARPDRCHRDEQIRRVADGPAPRRRPGGRASRGVGRLWRWWRGAPRPGRSARGARARCGQPGRLAGHRCG